MEKISLVLRGLDSRQEMADTTHFDTIAGALQNELRYGFSFHEVDQIDGGNGLP